MNKIYEMTHFEPQIKISIILVNSRLPCWFEQAVWTRRQSGCSFIFRLKKRRCRDACILFCLIYFFAPFSIYYILHNYVILQVMPHTIPQAHATFYPHRHETSGSKHRNCNVLTAQSSLRPHQSNPDKKYAVSKMSGFVWTWPWSKLRKFARASRFLICTFLFCRCTNRPFYSYRSKQGWGWSCFDATLPAFI